MIMRPGQQQLLLPLNPVFMWGSLIVAMLVNMLPIGRIAWTPDLLALVIVFWGVHQPARVSIGTAFIFGLTILWEVWTTGKQVPGYPSLMIGLMTIGGVQLIMIGIVGEYIGKILSELKARPIYFVAEHSEKRADGEASASASERTAAE